MIDDSNDVLKTFTDYQDESNIRFIKVHIDELHPWNQHFLREVPIPKEFLVVLILRNGHELIPNGSTKIEKGDLMVIAAQEFNDRQSLSMQEVIIDFNHSWSFNKIKDINLDRHNLIIMIKRKDETIIPDGNTVILPDDMLVIAKH